MTASLGYLEIIFFSEDWINVWKTSNVMTQGCNCECCRKRNEYGGPGSDDIRVCGITSNNILYMKLNKDLCYTVGILVAIGLALCAFLKSNTENFAVIKSNPNTQQINIIMEKTPQKSKNHEDNLKLCLKIAKK